MAQLLRRLLSVWASLALIAATLVLPGGSTAVGAPGDAPLSGTLFVDFDRDGTIDAGETFADTDPLYPPAGITVTVHDSAGASVAAVISSAAGGVTWSADVTSLVGHEFRVEFSLASGDLADGWTETFDGPNSSSSVVFAAAGSTKLDFGVIPPSECPTTGTGFADNPNVADGKLFATCFVEGVYTAGLAQDVVVGLNYDRSGSVEKFGTKNGPAEGQLGSVWGLAYDEWNSILYSSSFLRRHSGLGAEGIDGLYWATYPTGVWSSVSLDTLAGSPPSFGADITRDLGEADDPAYDSEAYGLVGKRGIGDIDVTPSGRYLLATNLDTGPGGRSLMVYDATGVPGGADPTFVRSVPVTNPGCADTANPDDYTIFGVTAIDEATAYVGVICTGQNSAIPRDTFPHPHLEAHVVPVPIGGGANASPVVSVPMSYAHGCGGTNVCNPNGSFLPWDDAFPPEVVHDPSFSDEFVLIHDSQPILSDIEVLDDGSLVLGFVDRHGHMQGNKNYGPDSPDTELYQYWTAGEILHVCNVGGDPANPNLAVEGEAGCDSTARFPNPIGAVPTDFDFHGGPYAAAEWYGDDSYDITGGFTGQHNETSHGGLYARPFSDEIVFSAMDPLTSFGAGGLGWLDTQTGEGVAGYDLYVGSGFGQAGKAAGIGDVEGCFIPVALGDYVWLDLDNDGIQDPGEHPLGNVVITITGGSLSGPIQVTTGPDGRWEATSADGLTHGESYTITIDASAATNLPAGVTPGDLFPTGQDATQDATDRVDSDMAPGTRTITTTPLDVGEVNHSYDAGFSIEHDLALAKTIDSTDASKGTVTFELTVTNQGIGPVEYIAVTDYIDPTLFEPFDAALNATTFTPVAGGTAANAFVYRWDGTDPTAPAVEIRGAALTDPPVEASVGQTSPHPSLSLFAGETVVVPITLRIAAPLAAGITEVENRAEISEWDIDAIEANGDSDTPTSNGTPLADVDSTADATDGSNAGETNGQALVDDEISGDGIAGGDEDDHDIATLPIADLALIKTRSAGQPYLIDTSGTLPTISFDITVKNQGAIAVHDIEITDAVPTGLTVQSIAGTTSVDGLFGAAPTITDLGPSGPDHVVGIDVLEPGEEITFDVVFAITDPNRAAYVNGAEISQMLDGPGGDDLLDRDSTPDSTLIDDPIDQTVGVDPTDPRNSHNDIDHDVDGSGDPIATPDDEDDHDTEVVVTMIPVHSIGNQVWADLDNDGQIDAGESGIAGVTVNLYADTDGDGQPDDTNNDGVVDADDAVESVETDANGYYLFDDLPIGTYVVGIPPSEWAESGPLFGWLSSDPTETDPNTDVDLDDNGAPGPHGHVWSGPISLGDGEPTGEEPDNDAVTADDQENLTVDFGFWQPELDLALVIQLDDGSNSAQVETGDTVTFRITVTNQGTVDADDIEIVNYLPEGLTLTDPDWTNNGDGTARITLPDTVAAGETTTVDITFRVDSDAPPAIDNFAEIADVNPVDVNGASILMPNGAALPDVDSTPDSSNADRFDTDDDTAGDGRAGTDEDDHDRVQLRITTSPGLALTGREAFPAVLAAIVLMAVGGGFLGAGRRREDDVVYYY